MPRRPQSPQKPQGFQGPRWPLAVGLAVGVGLDVLLGDPRRGHSVAAFGRAAAALPAAWAVTGARSLHHEAERALAALASHDLASARAVLPSLCGRDPAGLNAGEITRAVIESVAENTSDAVVAPLLWGALGGLPGLLVPPAPPQRRCCAWCGATATVIPARTRASARPPSRLRSLAEG